MSEDEIIGASQLMYKHGENSEVIKMPSYLITYYLVTRMYFYRESSFTKRYIQNQSKQKICPLAEIT